MQINKGVTFIYILIAAYGVSYSLFFLAYGGWSEVTWSHVGYAWATLALPILFLATKERVKTIGAARLLASLVAAGYGTTGVWLLADAFHFWPDVSNSEILYFALTALFGWIALLELLLLRGGRTSSDMRSTDFVLVLLAMALISLLFVFKLFQAVPYRGEGIQSYLATVFSYANIVAVAWIGVASIAVVAVALALGQRGRKNMNMKHFVSPWIGLALMVVAALVGLFVASLAFAGTVDEQTAITIGKACGAVLIGGFVVHLVQMIEGK